MENGVFTHFEADSWLIAKGKSIRLWKRYGQYEVYLDGTIVRRPTDLLVILVQTFYKCSSTGLLAQQLRLYLASEARASKFKSLERNKEIEAVAWGHGRRVS